ncbi:TNF receptor-associated factor 3-like [Dysidea avara]|uniref:TNF receptor-associated factor 3-like n=1 Tax=Dysidea avara TaxID=196820 RepID=UPI00332AB7C1
MAEGAPPTQQVEETGGYDNQFVEPVPDRLLCLICQYPSRDPQLSVCCGNVFCKSCLDAAKKVRSVEQVCPYCRNKEFPSVPNKQADREIRSLRVFCDNKQKGCDWNGEINDLNNHLKKSCFFELMQCPNNCGNMSERKYMASHVEIDCPRRMVICQYCGATGECQSMGAEHMEKCPKVLLPCPNKCTIRGVPREDMEAHRKECPLEIVQCEYHDVGCDERMARKDYVAHTQHYMDRHLRLTVHLVGIQQRHIEDLTATVAENKKELTAAKNELFSARKEISAARDELARSENERFATKERDATLKDTRSLALDLNTKLATQERHLTILQGKLQDDVKELKGFGEALKQKVEGNIETDLQVTKQELNTAKKELATVKHDLKNQTQTEMKEMQTYVDRQYQKVKADIDKDLSANNQEIVTLTQQFTSTKNELGELTKVTKRFTTVSTTAEQRVNFLDTKLEAEITNVKMKLNGEQKQTMDNLAATKHDIEHLKDSLRKMDQQFNMEGLQIEVQKKIDMLKGQFDQTYAPQKRVQDIEQQLGITPGQYNHLPWTRELYSTSITGEEMCPVIIKVPKFESKKVKEVKWCSHGFYTHNRGYKMCLRVIAGGAGAGKGTHLSVFLYLMKGQYDGQLEWPLKGEFEMTLLNQMMDDEHHSNTVKFSEKTPAAIANKVKSGEMAADGLGRNEFILERNLTMITPTCQYLKDDCIFIKVSRKP